MSKTLITFDFGKKSIGVAVGQCITNKARPLATLKAKNGKPNWFLVEKILKEWQPSEIIVGLPLNMDGTEQPLTKQARKFANKIQHRFGITVQLQDERLSSVEARMRLFQYGGFRSLKKGNVDSTSAAIILESFFEQNF